MAHGVVKLWKAEEGWGVISSSGLPSGRDAWAHFSAILAEGYQVLEPGDRVEFEIIQRWQDSFDFVAANIRKL